MRDTPSYADVLERTEPYDKEQPATIEVRVEEFERRRRHTIPKRTETHHRFYVVDHEESAVLHAGRETTNDHHNPYAAARARAFGYAAGYQDGQSDT